MITQTCDRVRTRVIAVPAMFRARFVVDFPAVRRVLRRLQKIIYQVNRVVEEVVVGLAAVDVNLAGELWV